MVEAPIRFDAREFLIHLYTCLCKAVLADSRFSTDSPADRVLGPILRPRQIRPAALVGSLSSIAFLVLSASLAYQAYGGRWPVPSWRHPQAWEIAGAALSFLAAAVAAGWRTRLALIEIRQVVRLGADAEARLRRLHFQRTDTRSRGGTLGGPAGTGLALGSTREFVEQAMSLPEPIDDYRDFAERVVAALVQAQPKPGESADPHQSGRQQSRGSYPADVRLVIGIDQMDQIDDPKAACKFLDEISAVFGTPGCVYLLAISPGALAAIDQRAIPLKTSSSGLFDDMVWIDSFTLNDVTKLLDDRVTGLPRTFIKLCYVLSGGLPRELLRIARAIFCYGAIGRGSWHNPRGRD